MTTHHAHDVVTHVPLPLQLLRVALLVGQQTGHVEHDLCTHRLTFIKGVNSAVSTKFQTVSFQKEIVLKQTFVT